MLTLKKVLENTEYTTLVRSVIRNIGMDSVEDVNRHGIDGGFNGFIYYKDTINFFKRHKKEIIGLACGLANDLGISMLVMVAGFNCLKDDHFKTDEIAAAIYANSGENVETIQNAMAWFAAEEVCRMFEN